jgi:hypothetical protein
VKEPDDLRSAQTGCPPEEVPDIPAELPDEQHQIMHARVARLEAVLGLAHGRSALHLPAWLRPTRGEHRLPVSLNLLLLVVLQLSIRSDIAVRPRLLVPIVEAVLFLGLTMANPKRIVRESVPLRIGGYVLLAAAGGGTAWTAYRLVYLLATGGWGDDAEALLLNGGAVWAMNVIVFAIVYWDFDRGGPAARAHARVTRPDFLFSQMTVPELTPRDWEPAFVDYLFLSFTNATAFSPTDTLPLARWAKLTMMAQSGIALVTAALVVARAVNIFK